jgi:hypothetical protein
MEEVYALPDIAKKRILASAIYCNPLQILISSPIAVYRPDSLGAIIDIIVPDLQKFTRFIPVLNNKVS